MGKLSQIFKNLIDKFKKLSKNKKIAFGVIIAGIIAAIVFAGISLGKTKYAVLFSNMDSKDLSSVYKQLQEDKVDVKVEGNSILVPEDEVDETRMKVLSEVEITNGSEGFELLDQSKLGSTDTEIKINYQRALQGELERTIKSLPEVENARVHLVLPDDTEFVKDTSPGSASVTLKLKEGEELSKEQVKALVSLVSGAVKNVPKENVQVIDDNMTLLSKDLFEDEANSEDSTIPAEKQQQLKEQYEKNLEKNLLSMLEAVYGKDKVEVKVNADLDFDAVQQNSTTYDNNSVVVSEHVIDQTSQGDTGNQTGSPVDNNMSNTITNNTTGGNSTYNETTRNYNVPKVEQKTVKAPGSVRRLTASVALDGDVDDATRTAIRNLAVSAIGYDGNRGDTISVEGLPFDTTAKDNAQKDMEDMEQAERTARRNRLIAIIGGIAAAIIATIIEVILWRRKHGEDELFEDEQLEGIDVVIGDEDTKASEKLKFKPLELEQDTEDIYIEREIKKYAKDKPDQVADIIKSWLAEDER
ncbi:flagellar basal-body MS-ring/collar protein FliF [Clostridium sp. BJN0013]|uniref:flagellar basal-body MS-ring/collar protein FliF n=1 Tax=Clostridium sp. BJN0013 TaxID=3236840 RepID=UPI0034C5BFBC